MNLMEIGSNFFRSFFGKDKLEYDYNVNMTQDGVTHLINEAIKKGKMTPEEGEMLKKSVQKIDSNESHNELGKYKVSTGKNVEGKTEKNERVKEEPEGREPGE